MRFNVRINKLRGCAISDKVAGDVRVHYYLHWDISKDVNKIEINCATTDERAVGTD